MEDVSTKLASAFGLIAAGILLKGLGLLRKSDGEVLFRFIFNATLPAMLLQVFLGITVGKETAVIVVSSLVQSAILLAVSLLFWKGNKNAAVLAGSTVGVNLGIFAYPLTEAVWGMKGLQAATVFDLVNQWTILVASYLLFYRYSDTGRTDVKGTILRRLANPCFISVYLALFLRIGGQTSLPPLLEPIIHSLAVANKAISLVAVGVVLEPKLRKSQLADIVCLLGMRYGVSLALAGGFLLFLSSTGYMAAFGLAKTAAIMIALTSPVPMMTVTYAFEFAADTQRAVAAVNLSNIISAALFFAVLNTDGYAAATRASWAFGGALASFTAAAAVFMRRKNRSVLERDIAPSAALYCPRRKVRDGRYMCTQARTQTGGICVRRHFTLHYHPRHISRISGSLRRVHRSCGTKRPLHFGSSKTLVA